MMEAGRRVALFWLGVTITAVLLGRVLWTRTRDRIEIIIVYNTFINLKRADWLSVISLQMEGLISNGLAARAKEIYVCVSTEFTNESDSAAAANLHTVKRLFDQRIPKARIMATMMNRYEYPGIKQAWDVGKRITHPIAARNTVVLYFHSKGMFNSKTKLAYVYDGKPAYKDEIERRLFATVIDNWNYVLEKMALHPELNKAGYAASPDGYIWLNFWFARASYLQTLVTPVISDNRYYYEDWLARLDVDAKWPALWSIEFPETHKSIRHGKVEQGSELENGYFGSNARDCLTLCKPRLPIGTNFTKNSIWKFCRPSWRDNFNGLKQLQPEQVPALSQKKPPLRQGNFT